MADEEDFGADAIVLKAEHLTVAFNGKRAVDGFDLTIRRGEVIGLLGESGCGKSTAAYALLGLVKPPGKITGGRVLLDGKNLLDMDAEAIRRVRGADIGLIVQNPRGALNPMLRVGRQIANVWQAHNRGSNQSARERALDMLKFVGINDPERRLEAYAHELSGGMAQRALIAMALSSKPRLLVADEPTSGLDVTIQAQFLDEMWQTVRRTGSSILLVTQETGIVANYCDRVVVMHEGAIVEDVPTRQFFRAPQHPYSRSVLAKTSEAPVVATDTGPKKTEPLFEVVGMTKYFPIAGGNKRVQAVLDVSFAMGVGETMGLVGESGSGKTTVGRSLMRLLQTDAGKIVFKGKDIGNLSTAELKRVRSRMQIVLQDPYDSVDPRWSVGRILAEPLDIHTSMSRAQKLARVHELLDLVAIDRSVMNARPRDIGSGALQRVNIARALATKPEFIILDEPTSVLAPSARASLILLLRRLQRELGLSFLFISHDLTTVAQVCDRVAVMYLSQIVEMGSTKAIFDHPRHPYSKALLASHLFPDPANRRVDRARKDVLSGEIPSPIDLPVGCYLYSRCPSRAERCASEPQILRTDTSGGSVRCWRATEVAAASPMHTSA